MRYRMVCVVLVGITSLSISRADCLRKAKPDAAARRKPEPVTVPVPTFLAHTTSRVLPVYPREARDAKIDGSVVIALEVNREGVVTQTLPLSGNSILQQAGVAALQQWHFDSFCIKGLPYTVRSAVEFQFRYRGAGSQLGQP